MTNSAYLPSGRFDRITATTLTQRLPKCNQANRIRGRFEYFRTENYISLAIWQTNRHRYHRRTPAEKLHNLLAGGFSLVDVFFIVSGFLAGSSNPDEQRLRR